MDLFPVILKYTSNQSKINTLLFYGRILLHLISRKPLPPVQIVLPYSNAPYSICSFTDGRDFVYPPLGLLHGVIMTILMPLMG